MLASSRIMYVTGVYSRSNCVSRIVCPSMCSNHTMSPLPSLITSQYPLPRTSRSRRTLRRNCEYGNSKLQNSKKCLIVLRSASAFSSPSGKSNAGSSVNPKPSIFVSIASMHCPSMLECSGRRASQSRLYGGSIIPSP